jgi:CBS domain-containing protein
MKLKDFWNPNRKLKTVTPEDNITLAAKGMKEAHCGDVIVTSSKGSEILGIVTDRDIVLRCVAEGKSPEFVKIDDIMTRNPIVLHEDHTGSEALEQMKRNGVARIIVADQNGKPQGVVSADHILKYLSAKIHTLASLSKSMHERENQEAA